LFLILSAFTVLMTGPPSIQIIVLQTNKLNAFFLSHFCSDVVKPLPVSVFEQGALLQKVMKLNA